VSTPEAFLQMAVELACTHVSQQGGRPFGAVLVKDGQVVATGVNQILATHDPTAHAEIEAMRAATRHQASPRLDGHVMYASGHPCPMCLAAMYLAGITQVYYAHSNNEAEAFGLSTAKLYAELAKPFAEQSLPLVHLPVTTAQHPYLLWQARLAVVDHPCGG
jgi:guanine deaminase